MDDKLHETTPEPDELPEDTEYVTDPTPPDNREQMLAALNDPDATPTNFSTAAVRAAMADTQKTRRVDDSDFENRHGLIFGHNRDIGMVRTNNEDSTVVFFASQINAEDNPDFGIFIVADGAGGHEHGEMASAEVCRIMIDELSEKIYQPMLLQHLDNKVDIPPISEVLAEAVQLADKHIQKEVPGGGSTLTAMVLIGDLAHIAHVGDSRAYLLTTQDDYTPRFEQLTRDHSVAKRLEEIGQITAEEALNHPEAGRLWKIMGLTENLEPDISTRRIPAGGRLLLCSDGLWNMVGEDEMVKIILDAPDPQEAADHLLMAANANGGVDNISVIVIQMP